VDLIDRLCRGLRIFYHELSGQVVLKLWSLLCGFKRRVVLRNEGFHCGLKGLALLKLEVFSVLHIQCNFSCA
jgi:hypothetical protein